MDFPCFCSIFESCEACITMPPADLATGCNCVAESDRCPACDWARSAPSAPALVPLGTPAPVLNRMPPGISARPAPSAPAPAPAQAPPPAAPQAVQECCICLEEVAGPFMICVCQIKTCVECARKNGSSGADLHKCPGCRGMMVYPDGYQPRGTVRARDDDSDSDSDGGFVLSPARRRRRWPVDGEPACLGIRMLELPQHRLDEVMDRLFLDYSTRATKCDLLNVLKRRIKNYLKKCQHDVPRNHRFSNANRIILKLRGHCGFCRTHIEKTQRSLMHEMD